MAIRLSHRDVQACSGALRTLYDTTALTEFPERLLGLLAQLVPVQHITYNEFDDRQQRYVIVSRPESRQIQALIPQLIASIHTHPLFEHYRNAGAIPRKISDITTFRQFSETAAYREYYQHVEVKHQMLFFLQNNGDARIGLSLTRRERDFSERDRSVLAYLSPHITQAHWNARIASESALNLERVGAGLGAMHRALALVETGGRILWVSPLAGEWLEEFFPDYTKGSPKLPAGLRQWLARAEKSAQSGPPSFSELHLPTATSSRLIIYGAQAGNDARLITLVRERVGIDAALAAPLGLTPREAEILFWITEAKSNPEIARICGVSPRTIHKHVEHLFAKLGVENRLEAQRLGLELRRS